MPHKHPKALPTTASTATTPTAAGTPAATAAPERRSWFRRDRRAGADLGPAAAGVGAGTAAGAYAGVRPCLLNFLLPCLTCYVCMCLADTFPFGPSCIEGRGALALLVWPFQFCRSVGRLKSQQRLLMRAGENKYGAYPDRDVEAGRTPGAAGTPGYSGSPTGAGTGAGYGTTGTGAGTGYGTTPGYGTTTGAGVDPTLAGEAPSAVPGQKRRGGFMSLVGLGNKNKGGEGAAAPAGTAGYGGTGAGVGGPAAASAPPPPSGSYEQPTGASSAWHTAGHGLSGAPAPAT